jgi:excinuclease ABC subunit C
VNSEFDALLLENGLIKENQPKYNILLKDDKTFPSILITNERFPKIYSTRRIIPELGEYFGPYTSVKAMNNVLDLLRKLYKVRTCSLNLTENNITKSKFKVCLEYHIGNCKGPCEGLQTEENYLADIELARQIIKGNISKIKNEYKEQMSVAAASLNFESAQNYKDKLETLERFQTKSTIVNPSITNTDVITIIYETSYSYINYMKIEQGIIKVSDTFEVRTKLEESIEEIFEYVIPSMQTKFRSSASILLTNAPTEEISPYELITPQIGDKRKLVDLSFKNALYFKREVEEKKRLASEKPDRILSTLQSDLKLKSLPVHIECFDNSNIQGTNPVASMVCFRNGKPAKKDYRQFKIKTVEGPDDFGSMKEIVFRRYSRLLREDHPLPDLIVIDGGKGQLSAAVDSLKELSIYGQIPIIGIAKRLEELYFPGDTLPLFISKKSESLKLIQQLRDEAHRFAITFHRNLRSKSANISALDEIPGIGPKLRTRLLTEFGSVSNIKKANRTAITAVIGSVKAEIVHSYFNKKNRD